MHTHTNQPQIIEIPGTAAVFGSMGELPDITESPMLYLGKFTGTQDLPFSPSWALHAILQSCQ